MPGTPMTPEGYKQLEEKIRQLKDVELPRIQQAIQEALAHGDLSENSELDAAREEDSRVRTMLMELEQQYASAEIIDESQVPKDSIAIGAKITLKDLKRGGTFEYMLVGEGETRDDIDIVSVGSPLGQALIGKKAGEVAEFNGPRGPLKYEVVEFTYS